MVNHQKIMLKTTKDNVETTEDNVETTKVNRESIIDNGAPMGEKNEK